jgi:hypothetical protein
MPLHGDHQRFRDAATPAAALATPEAPEVAPLAKTPTKAELDDLAEPIEIVSGW